MLILSHRGVHTTCPENTLAAFEQAIVHGVHGIETDIRLDAQGVPILYHDRVAPTGAPVSELARDELSRAVGYAVPTLQDALDSFDQVLWNLEIKELAAVPETLAILGQYQDSHRILLTSFHHVAVEQVLRCGTFDAGLLVAHRPIEATSMADWFPEGSQSRFIVWDYETADQVTVERAAAVGIRSFVYGAATRAEHERLASWNLCGVITDYPGWLLKI